MTTRRTVHLRVVDACASTQGEARADLDLDATRIVVVRTRRQLQGLGRRGRVWHSPPQAGLMLSIGLRGGMHTRVLDGFVRDTVTLLHAALARHAGIDRARLAWSAPNDLVDAASGDKLAGVLVDATSIDERVEQLLVGIGVNVAGDAFALPGEQRRAATLEHAAGHPVAADDDALDALAVRLAEGVARRAGITPRAAPPA